MSKAQTIKRLAALSVSGMLFCHFQNVNVSGCGGGWEPTLLDNGGSVILSSAPFFFDLEMREMAKQFPSKYRTLTPKEKSPHNSEHWRGLYKRQSSDADSDDVSKALPADADAQARLRAAREFIDSGADGDGPLEALPAGEFADYLRGALMFKRENFAAAAESWKKLLARPSAERRWRSTWAAFMLGKVALREKNYAAAKKYFQLTRQLADSDYADSLGLAASSLGWEARANLAEENYERAARLYLRQLSSGDDSAYVSLNMVASAHEKNYERFVNDAVLRKIVSARWIYGSCFPGDHSYYLKEKIAWLRAVEKARLPELEEADRLAWLAYETGDFSLTKRWLKFVKQPTGLSLWLRAKLAFRDGEIDDATKLMERAAQYRFSNEKPTYFGEQPEHYEEDLSQRKAADSDLGLLQLANAEFGKAFVSLVKSGFLRDAAYVGERVLSPEELAGLIEQNFPAQKPDVYKSYGEAYWFNRPYWLWKNKAAFAREILARRLTRLERFNEAKKYFASDMQERLAEYAAAVKTGKNPKKSKEERIEAFTQAAVLAKRDLLGRWTAWSGYWSWDHGGWRGAYDHDHVESSVYWDRLHGTLGYFSINGRLQKPEKTSPLTLRVSKAERQRLEKFAEPPDIRDYTNYIAAEWDWRAAQLMPADDEQTAWILNRAGTRLYGHYDTLPNKYYEAILRRCPNTKIGAAVAKKRWFIPLDTACELADLVWDGKTLSGEKYYYSWHDLIISDGQWQKTYY